MLTPTAYLTSHAPELLLTKPAILQIATAFQTDLQKALAHHPSSLKALPSFLGVPTSQETGRYLSVDFGGTNLRVLDIELYGQGRYTIHAQSKVSLANAGNIDCTASACHSDTLFDFIAQQIADIAQPSMPYNLGHTFSFPSHQIDRNQATLLHWTKEIKTTGVVGLDINQALHAALLRQNLPNICPVVILNDTVGTLITAAYGNPAADIGSICGTGHNTAYLEQRPPNAPGPMFINLESGNFDQLPLSRYDCLLDAQSDKPGEQRLEKMVSGRYLGELLRLAALDLLHNTVPKDLFLQPTAAPWSLTAEQVAAWLLDQSAIAAWLQERMKLILPEQLAALQLLANRLCTRSARLVAASHIGILRHIDPALEKNHHIAIDGSLFEKLPGYQEAIRQALTETLADHAGMVTVGLCKDGSGVGAAIAAALATASRNK